MSSLVIVAIPAEDDIVWKVSSEKKPHLTLMYLGEVSENNNVNRMADFVAHALNISEHGPFYLDVDYRGELGEDKADVLFFSGGWDTKWIKSLRGQLLQQSDIRTAFESADQFPGWVPHLTLGYPTAPANEIPDDRKIYSVNFDRLAVWTGDYEGPEFRLQWSERDFEGPDAAVAYGDTGQAVVADILGHSGVKGMRWGHRKDPSVIERPKNNLTPKQTAVVGVLGGGGAVAGASAAIAAAPAMPSLPVIGAFAGASAGLGLARTNKSVAKALDANERQNAAYQKDKRWEKDFKKDKRYADVHNDMADHMNSWLPGHNKKYDGIDLNKDPKKMKEYEDSYFKEQSASFARSYEKTYGSSPSGKYKVSVIPGTDKVVLHSKNVDPIAFKHAANDEPFEPLMTFQVTHDTNGRIVKVEAVESVKYEPIDGEAMAQSTDLVVADILGHSGVKGMKWGVRKDRQGRDRFSPEGHDTGRDVAKALLLGGTPFGVPAHIRLGKRAVRGTKAYMEKRKSPEEVTKREKRKLARRDFYWESHTYSDISHADVHNKVADEIDTKVFQLSNSPKYRGKSLKADKALKDQYDQDIAKVTDAAYRRAVKDTYGVNPSGTKSAHYVDDARGPRIEVRDTKTGKSLHETELKSVQDVVEEHDTLGHAASDPPTADKFDDPQLIITVKTDDNGFITEIGRVKLPEDEAMAQSARGELFVDELIHYGIKGMHWGRRKSPPEAATPTAESHVPVGKRRKTKIEVDGGENHPAHEDAIKIAKAQVKLKRSGPAALSNKELQDVANRLRLEQQVKELQRSEPRKFVREFITGQGKQTLNVAAGSRIQKRVRAPA